MTQKMFERGTIMLLHATIIGIVIYLLMVFLFKQRPAVAENRSIILAANILIYMVLFGHGLPTQFNPNIF